MEGPRFERAHALLCYVFCAWNAIWNYFVIFYACGGPVHGKCSGVIVLYFLRVEVPRVEFALLLLCYIFCTWNALCCSCVLFSASGGRAHRVRSGIILLYFPRVERALALLCFIFSLFRMCSGIIVLYLPRVERAIIFCVELILCCNILTL